MIVTKHMREGLALLFIFLSFSKTNPPVRMEEKPNQTTVLRNAEALSMGNEKGRRRIRAARNPNFSLALP
jgi:hypothetical protein